jgi:hypothetical protein
MVRRRREEIAMARFLMSATAALALSLGACSGKSDEPVAEGSSEAAPLESTSAPEIAATAEPTQAVADDAIPPLLRGRWGLVAADCTSTAGDAKGLLTIGAKQLKFYESVARLGAIKSVSADAVTAGFAFSGEGQSWTLQVALSTPDGGETLVRKDTGPDAAPQPLTYKKCA